MGPSQKDELVAPMMATAGPVPTTAGWAFEFKWDGIRAVVAVEPSGVRAMSRNLRDVTRSYPVNQFAQSV
jgi:bifunctional non-homologous end joining protein LigD